MNTNSSPPHSTSVPNTVSPATVSACAELAELATANPMNIAAVATRIAATRRGNETGGPVGPAGMTGAVLFMVFSLKGDRAVRTVVNLCGAELPVTKVRRPLNSHSTTA